MAQPLPPVIPALSEIAGNYDAFLIDQWGVLHNGIDIYPEALEALAQLKAAGKQVIILSNSGRPGAENGRSMQKMGIAPDLYDRVLTAGDDAIDALSGARDPAYQQLGDKVLVLSRPGEECRVDQLGLTRVTDVAQADFIFVLSMDEVPQIPAAWQEVLRLGRQRSLPLICANPDLWRVQGEGEVLVAPGAVALAYEEMGGTSYYHGKPHERIYRTALRLLGTEASRVLMIGDSLIHDVRGARQAGIDSLFLVNGVHRERVSLSDPDSLARELEAYAPDRPTWVIDRLR